VPLSVSDLLYLDEKERREKLPEQVLAEAGLLAQSKYRKYYYNQRTGNIKNIMARGVCNRTTRPRRRQEVFATKQRSLADSGECLSSNNDSLPVTGSTCNRTMRPCRRREVFAAKQQGPADGRKCLLSNNTSLPATGGTCNRTMRPCRRQEVFATEQRGPAGGGTFCHRILTINNESQTK
jgi:hypothetical protein